MAPEHTKRSTDPSEPDPSDPGSSFPDAIDSSFDDDVRAERGRYFQVNRWSVVVGNGSAAALWATLVSSTNTPPELVGVWLVSMLAIVCLHALIFVMPSLQSVAQDDSHPLIRIANVLVGVGFGLMLWIDLDATRDPEFRWITLATLFALSAGTMAGFSGVNSLGQHVNIPMWTGAASALLATGQYAAAGAGVIFAVLTVRDMIENGGRWDELIRLKVMERVTAQKHLWAATHDPLTSLINRKGIMSELEMRSSDQIEPVTLMFVDLDHFKEVNDRHGHAAGDHVLVETADRLRSALRTGDAAGRLGGDEFCVLLRGHVQHTAAEALAARIISEIEAPIHGPWGDEEVYISASIGIASVDPEQPGRQQLLLEADYALYHAKRTGRRRAVRFDHQLRTEIQQRSGLESELRRALREDGVEVAAQPVFNIVTGEIVAVELLARWRLLGGAMVPPSVFIPMAEDIGLIEDLTDVMLRRAGLQIERWQGDPLLGGARVSVNISAIEFARGDLVTRVAEVVSAFSIPEDRLVLEVTESHHLNGNTSDVDQFASLRAMGVHIAIDDFGTGYSSLDNLLTLPIDIVKLDHSLINELGTDPRQTALLKSIGDMALVVGHQVIAEGVETLRQLETLQSLGHRYAQGYYLCRPVPVDELADHLDILGPFDPGASVSAQEIG